MATYLYSSFGYGAIFTDFDPAADVLSFDENSLAATWLNVTYNGTDVSLGAAILLNVDIRSLSATNVVFADGSKLLVGDTLSTIDNDDGANTLSGGSGHDQLLGLGGDDLLAGGLGNDILDGGSGADTLIGGAGDDTYHVDSTGDVVEEMAGYGAMDRVVAYVSYTLADNCEQLTLAGGSEPLSGTGNATSNVIYGNDGNNTLSGLGGDDQLYGSAGDDVLLGGQGNDGLSGGIGADTLVGGTGSDSYSVDQVGDVIQEDPDGGHDVVQSPFSMVLPANVEMLFLMDGTGVMYGVGNASDNNLMGNAGPNLLSGLGGNDYLDGWTGADTLMGGPGNDTYTVDSPADVVWEPVAGNAIVRVSSSGTGSQAGAGSSGGVISADGRYVAFNSYAADLASGDLNGSVDVYLKDVATGQIERVSSGLDGLAGNGHSDVSDISPDGRYVVFTSGASNLVAGDTNGFRDVFLLDRTAGEIECVSTGSTGTQGDGDSSGAQLSADGRYVILHSAATNLIADDTNGGWDIFVKDRLTGATTRYGIDPPGTESEPWFDEQISADGDVIFANHALTLEPQLTLDGRQVVFWSEAVDFVPGDTNNLADVFVLNLRTDQFTRVSTSASGAQGNGLSKHADISLDGRFVAFSSLASNLVPGDTNGTYDVFVKDVCTGAIARVSTTAAGVEGAAASSYPQISDDGRFIVFESFASNLVAGDTNGAMDVFRVANPLLAGSGVDRVHASFSYVLPGTIENLSLGGSEPINGVGNALNNELSGNQAANLLSGLAGNDTLSGWLGRDTLQGGLGNDTYELDADNTDVIIELPGQGIDIVRAEVSCTLAPNVEQLVLEDDAAANGIGNALGNRLTGSDAANVLSGLAGNDTVLGAGGNDKLIGGAGNDALTGGLGRDIFRFDAAPSATVNRDTISDFRVVDDTIQLENAVFAKVGSVGNLAATAFWKSATATAAHDASDRIVYNTTTGALYYDPDGTGPLAKVQFATLTGSPDTVTNLDFVVT